MRWGIPDEWVIPDVWVILDGWAPAWGLIILLP